MPWTDNFKWFKYLNLHWIKLKSHDYYPINGSDFVHALFGANATNIFKLLKKLFEVQDPMVNVTSRKQAPNHKVDHSFSHLIQVSNEEFETDCNLSSDRQDASFQVHHEDK